MVCRIPLVTKSYHCPTSSQQLLLSSLQNPGLLLLLSFPPNPGLFLSTAQSCNQLTLLGLLLQLRLGKIPHFLILRFLNFLILRRATAAVAAALEKHKKRPTKPTPGQEVDVCIFFCWLCQLACLTRKGDRRGQTRNACDASLELCD